MAISLLPPVIVGLFICSIAYGHPLPRLVLPQESASFLDANWELRPASRPAYAVSPDADFLNNAYIQGRFDPDRPYIQMIVPRPNGIATYEAKPGGPFGPTAEPPTTSTTTPADGAEGGGVGVCINSTSNATLNGTAYNGTVCSNQSAAAGPVARLMLADGMRIYPVDEGQARSEWSPSGAYELMYTAYRPRPVSADSLQLYPVIQYADYNYLGWRGGYPLGGYPGVLEPVYIYRPVYPSALRSYDVYYYFPVAEQQSHAEVESSNTKTKNAEASEITMPNAADNSEASPQSQAQVESVVPTTPNPQEEVESQENPVSDADESNEIEKEEPVTENEQVEVAEAEPGEKTGESEENSPSNWEKELEKISDQDLMAAIEKVLQQIHSRLSD